MRRPILAGALVLGVLAAAAQQGTTAGNVMPASSTTLDYGRTAVEGGTLLQISYSYDSAGRATGFVAHMKGNLLGGPLTGAKIMTADYPGGLPLLCDAGVLSPLSSLLGDATQYSCFGAAPRDGLPSVNIHVS